MTRDAATRRRAVVVVSYGAPELLEQNLTALDLDALDAAVVVVDNWHSPATRAHVSRLCESHGWELVPMDRNTGFGHAANAGVARAQTLGASTVLLLNPDLRASTSDLESLAQASEGDPRALVAPTITRPDGRVWFRGATVDIPAGRTRAVDSAAGPHAWLTGACLATSVRLWDRVGGFQPEYFLYWEDVDLSWRVHASGGRLAVLPGVEVTHDVGGTQEAGGTRAKSAVYVRYNCRNRLLFAAQHLTARQRLQWLLTAPRYAREVLLRGGRRAMLRRPGLLVAALRGSLEGAGLVLASLAGTPAERPAARTRYPRVRLYETLRTAHLERAHALTPASIIYGTRRYDFDADVARGLDLIQAGLLETARVLWRSDVRAIEVNEPLMGAGTRRAAVAVAALRLRRPRRRPRVVAYAIENRAPSTPRRGLRGAARHAVDLAAQRTVWRALDRLAFGTSAAAALYAQLLPARGPERRVIPALPQACDCPAPVDAAGPDRVLFLGALSERKGFPVLVEAWPAVRAAHPGAALTVVGKGALEDAARALAGADPDVTLLVDPPRTRVHAELRRAAVLALPSQPTATWREQVGLPIVEGLAHGCAVVTTDQTGLASWLHEHGHRVLPTPTAPADLAAAVVAALAERRDRADVLAPLPGLDGRLAADRWLFEEGPRPDDDGGR